MSESINPERYASTISKLGKEGKSLQRFVDGKYTLRIKGTGFKVTQNAGDGLTLDFEIVKGPEGETGLRDYMFMLGLTEQQKGYRANDITFFLRACGVPEAELKATFAAACTNKEALAGALVDAEFVTEHYTKRDGTPGQITKGKFFKSA